MLELIKKIKDLIAAARASDWVTAITILLDLIKDGIGFIPIGATPKEMVQFVSSDRPEEEILCELEVACDDKGATAMAAGDFLKNIMPLLLGLLRKWLGF